MRVGKQRSLPVLTKHPRRQNINYFNYGSIYRGEALKTIENLGHSGYAYEAAEERLERKFGGQRRQNAIRLEEVENFKPLRPDNSKDLEVCGSFGIIDFGICVK